MKKYSLINKSRLYLSHKPKKVKTDKRYSLRNRNRPHVLELLHNNIESVVNNHFTQTFTEMLLSSFTVWLGCVVYFKSLPQPVLRGQQLILYEIVIPGFSSKFNSKADFSDFFKKNHHGLALIYKLYPKTFPRILYKDQNRSKRSEQIGTRAWS